MHKGDPERAIIDFDRALELDPKLAVAYTNRGLAWLLQGKDDKAQKDFEQCLLIKPDLKAELEKRIELAKEVRSKKP
jgi:tetratricopeptide (TPR) repeat protein